MGRVGEWRNCMGLHIRRASSRRAQLIATLFAVFALVAQPLYGALASQIAAASSGLITQMGFETEARTVKAGDRSAALRVRTKNSANSNESVSQGTTLILSSNSPTGRFARSSTADFS